mmetsp:Transcript_54058/g.126234  ORF Transcript_54058/g.126234 Transcript_54058/m.126234 type:complete len:209 (+) Transcript_54058:111-737(+)
MGRPCLRSKLQRPSSFRWLQPLQEDLAGTAHFQEALVRIGIWRFVRVERRALLAVHGVHLLAILRDVALLKTEQGRSLLRIQRQLPTLGVENRNSFAVVLCVVLHPLLRTIHPIPLAEAISHSMLVVLNLGLDLPSFIVLPPMPSLPRFHCALILDKKQLLRFHPLIRIEVLPAQERLPQGKVHVHAAHTINVEVLLLNNAFTGTLSD